MTLALEKTNGHLLLTDRHMDILRLLADGLSNAEIASEVHISKRTVENHVGEIFSRLGIDGRKGGGARVLAARRYREARGMMDLHQCAGHSLCDGKVIYCGGPR